MMSVPPEQVVASGEYPLQDGFGWTNGVTLKMLDLISPERATV